MPSPAPNYSTILAQSTSPRRQLLFAWLAAGLFIPCLSAFGRPLQHWTYLHVGETTAAWVIGLLLIGLGGMAIQWLAKLPLSSKRYTLMLFAIILLIALFSITILLPQTEERLHFVTFGLFGFLCRRLFSPWIATLCMLLWASGDELFQAWLPDRVGDWRDVGMNTLAGTCGLGIAWFGARFLQSQDNDNIRGSGKYHK